MTSHKRIILIKKNELIPMGPKSTLKTTKSTNQLLLEKSNQILHRSQMYPKML